MKYSIDVMISKEEIAEKVAELGARINEKYKDSEELVLIALLRGSVIFMADLARELKLGNVRLDFMTVSSYGNSMTSSRDVKIKKDIEDSIKDKDVLIVEDLIDTGFTLSKVVEILKIREPKSLSICTLLDKPARREANVEVEFSGFQIPDEFVVGYGIDYAEKHRELPFIGKVIIEK
ncbi:hypoxanthine phosphoribosyltransferase [Psychrilyobacter sp.]|uniref:hypoxanthine phosphoribosyltransferase n=1 Tax=Psychrilyobacter sp. TaxID=2586924 RepID=UPI00301B6B3F